MSIPTATIQWPGTSQTVSKLIRDALAIETKAAALAQAIDHAMAQLTPEQQDRAMNLRSPIGGWSASPEATVQRLLFEMRRLVQEHDVTTGVWLRNAYGDVATPRATITVTNSYSIHPSLKMRGYTYTPGHFYRYPGRPGPASHVRIEPHWTHLIPMVDLDAEFTWLRSLGVNIVDHGDHP